MGKIEGMLPIREVSRLLGVHPNTVRRWGAKGIIREYRQPGGHRRIRVEDVTAILLDSKPGGR